MNQPNIILITADGLRWDSSGCAGNPDVRTPNIDALAAHGLQFSHAFTPCAHVPSGAHAFLTGAVPTAFDPEVPAECPDAEPLFLASGLRAAGYVTAAVGALDLSAERLDGNFDHVLPMACDGLDDAYHAWLKAEGQCPPEGDDFPARALVQEASHPTTWVGNEAVRLARSVLEPFFLWVSLPRPRGLLDPPVPWKHLYRPSRLKLPAGTAFELNQDDRVLAGAKDLAGLNETDYRRTLTAWYGSISHVDRQVGRLMATLTSRGRTNNVFAITAGRGAYMGFRGLVHTEPGPLYEPVVRVPMIIGGIGGQRRGATDSALVSTGDVVPTLLEAAYVDLPPLAGGRSLMAQLREDGIPHRRAIVYCGAGRGGLRTARYKWLTGVDPGAESLFDLQADPLEQHNLAGERQSLAIRRMLLASLGSSVVDPQN